MTLEAKARISWGKCSTQMEPETLLFYKGKTHARAYENVDPKEHRALLGFAGASQPVLNIDMTLASEKKCGRVKRVRTLYIKGVSTRRGTSLSQLVSGP